MGFTADFPAAAWPALASSFGETVSYTPKNPPEVHVTSIADLYMATGYWDDVPGVRVAGTAAAGTKIVLDMTGTVDRGATDNILYPTAGVWISGPGSSSLTIQGRLFIQGPGGTAVVTR